MGQFRNLSSSVQISMTILNGELKEQFLCIFFIYKIKFNVLTFLTVRQYTLSEPYRQYRKYLRLYCHGKNNKFCFVILELFLRFYLEKID